MGNGELKGIRPRLGVLAVTSGWFRDVGLQSAEGDTSVTVSRTADRLIAKIQGFADTVFGGVVYSTAEAEKEARAIREAEVDGLLLVPLMWCEDAIPRAALAMLADLPLILWTFSPEPRLPDFLPFPRILQGSGPVCTLQLSGMLRREGRAFKSVVGHLEDPEVFDEIRALATGMAVRRRLASLRIGLLPFPCSQMSTTYVDEFGLRARYGIELRPLELERVRKAAAESNPAAIEEFRAGIAAGAVRVEVDERNLVEGIRYALALRRLAAEERLGALAMNDVIEEMHASFGLRPCLSDPVFSGTGVVVSMEADVAAAAGMAILRLATGDSPFYTEPFSADYEANAILMGHAGYHDGSNADPRAGARVVSDVEYENSDRFTGAVTLFKYRPGPVTTVNSVWSGGEMRASGAPGVLKWVIAEGESLPGPAKMDGNAHLVFRPDARVKDFFAHAVADGVSQHWLFVPGRISRALESLCGVLGIEASVVGSERTGAGAVRTGEAPQA
jgi:L-arabinose isomerase